MVTFVITDNKQCSLFSKKGGKRFARFLLDEREGKTTIFSFFWTNKQCSSLGLAEFEVSSDAYMHFTFLSGFARIGVPIADCCSK
jgi:hypothetical protein